MNTGFCDEEGCDVSQITYLTGDATQPQSAGPKLIVHVCNDIGGWGRGFVVASLTQ